MEFLDPLSSGGAGLPDLDKSSQENRKEKSKLEADFPKTFLKQAETLAVATRSIDPDQVTVPFDSPTAEKVTEAVVGQTTVHAAEVDQIEDATGDDEEQNDWDFDGLGGRVGEESTKDSASKEPAIDEVGSIGRQRSDESYDVSTKQGMALLAKAFSKGATISLSIGSNNEVEFRSPSPQIIDYKKFAIYNQESKVVVHAGYAESELDILKQDSRLKKCRFIGLSPENLATFRPLLLQIINANKVNAVESKREAGERKAGSYISESRAELLSREGIKGKTKRDAGNVADGVKVARNNQDANQLKKEAIEAKEKRTEQMHIEEAEDNKKELWVKDRERILEKKDQERELGEERINRGKI